jgi:Zn-dependent protease
MLDLSLQMLLFRVVALLLIAAAQGMALAGAAALLGDAGPKHDGRLTPSPAAHLDLVGGVAFVVFRLGWTKTVALDPQELRLGRGGIVLIVAAGLAACLGLSLVLAALRQPALLLFSGNFALGLAAFCDVASGLSLLFALFNVLPIPPLTGGHLLQALHPPLYAWADRQRAVCVIVVAALLATGLAERAIGPIYAAIGGR